MHTYCNLRRANNTITASTIEIEGLKGLKGIVLFGEGLVTSGYLHTLPRSRLEGILHEGPLAGGEAEPDGKQRGGPGAAPAPPHRAASPRVAAPRSDAHAAQGGGRGGLSESMESSNEAQIEIRYVFYAPPYETMWHQHARVSYIPQM